MTHSDILPVTNQSGYYEIRLESIGGLGANLCGKMLGELGVRYLNLNASSFSSYGSEKRGAPVKSYIRWCDNSSSIRISSPVIHPHILGIFHSGLLSRPETLEGLLPDTKIIINTPLTAEKIQSHGSFLNNPHPPVTLFSLDASKIARDCHSRVNMVMMGALIRVMGFVSLDSVTALCADTFGKKYPDALADNINGLTQGYHLSPGLSLPENKSSSPGAPSFSWGYQDAPLGGVNPVYGSTVSNDLSPSRDGYIPLFLNQKCINCGLCDSTCPDLVFQFLPGIYKGNPHMINHGLDYYHCKGCLRCVDVCPTGALVKVLESDYPKIPWFLPNVDLLPDAIHYEKTGANSWVTSDSYLTERHIDGGIL